MWTLPSLPPPPSPLDLLDNELRAKGAGSCLPLPPGPLLPALVQPPILSAGCSCHLRPGSSSASKPVTHIFAKTRWHLTACGIQDGSAGGHGTPFVSLLLPASPLSSMWPSLPCAAHVQSLSSCCPSARTLSFPSASSRSWEERPGDAAVISEARWQ